MFAYDWPQRILLFSSKEAMYCHYSVHRRPLYTHISVRQLLLVEKHGRQGAGYFALYSYSENLKNLLL